MRQLRIGISACYFHADPMRAVFKGKTLLYLEQSIAHWAMSQGATVYLIPSVSEGGPFKLARYAQDLDGLILQGGSDVSPKWYGEEPLKPEWAGDYVRDCYEVELLAQFMLLKKPVLGVCRGLQLLNIAFGGSLHQDIATQVPGARNHRDWNIYDQNFHEIEIEPGSHLSKWLGGATRGKVNTVHHQAVNRLGNALQVEARSQGDGIIEAFRLQASHYVYGVQWHPEFHDSDDRSLLDGRPILAEFLRRAKGES